jgi:D-citramalate synthase
MQTELVESSSLAATKSPQTRKRHIEIMDTPLRDGEQTSGCSFSASEKLTIAQLLLTEVKVDRIEIASARVSDGGVQGCQKNYQWAAANNMLIG